MTTIPKTELKVTGVLVGLSPEEIQILISALDYALEKYHKNKVPSQTADNWLIARHELTKALLLTNTH